MCHNRWTQCSQQRVLKDLELKIFVKKWTQPAERKSGKWKERFRWKKNMKAEVVENVDERAEKKKLFQVETLSTRISWPGMYRERVQRQNSNDCTKKRIKRELHLWKACFKLVLAFNTFRSQLFIAAIKGGRKFFVLTTMLTAWGWKPQSFSFLASVNEVILWSESGMRMWNLKLHLCWDFLIF